MVNNQNQFIMNTINHLSYNILKKIIDTAFALILLLLLMPLLILISIVVYLETGMNPIFSQQRGVVLEKSLFRIYKFKTLQKHHSSECKKSDKIFIKENLINLVTASGYFLRKTGLDELPQLVNIILGEMSFIGPRPLAEGDLITMKTTEPVLYERRTKLSPRPGISGYWQIYGSREKGIKNLVECEEEYEIKKSTLFDIFLVFMTIPVILFGRHTDSIIADQVKKKKILQYFINLQKQRLCYPPTDGQEEGILKSLKRGFLKGSSVY